MKKLYFITLILFNFLVFAQAQNVEIQGNAKITGTVEVMDTILFADGSQLASACLSLLQDADGDTKITVEQSPDSDEILLISEGETVAIIDKDNLRIIHKGNSIFIGINAGEDDDGNNGNIFLGNGAGAQNTFGSHNVYMGNNAGSLNTSGTDNVYLGEQAGARSSGANNVSIGGLAGFTSDGNQNTYLGHQAGETMDGSRNTILGSSAGANAKGDGNVLVGADAGKSLQGNNRLVIHNTPSLEPLISGEFDNLKLTLNADTKVEKVLSVQNEIQMLNLTQGPDNGIKFGFENVANFGINAFDFRLPFPPFTSVGQRLNFGNYVSGDLNNILTLTTAGRVGIGTVGPFVKFEVVSSAPVGHIMKIENTAPGIQGDGLEIKLNRPTNGAGNNFITFTDEDGISGRIEGFNIAEDIAMAAFPDIDFSNYFDIISIQNLAFNPGSLPNISGGQLPFLSGGSFPTLNPGLFPNLNPGQFPTLQGGTIGMLDLNANFNFDALIFNVACGPFCSNPQEIYSFNPSFTGTTFPSLNGGSLPSLSGGSFPSLSGGSFPNLNPGSFPTISGGSLPSFNLDVVFDPSPITGAFASLKEVMCWAIENGERSLMTTNPNDLKMMENVSYLNNLADCKNGGVTYGSGGADYAEYLRRNDLGEKMRSGQIVGVRGGEISKNTEKAEQLLVVSMMPIVLGNMPEDADSIVNYEKIAFLGQAPVWVVGQVSSGDYIIPSGNHDGYGIAVKQENIKLEHLPLIVGRAWSDGNASINLVNMAIGLKTQEISIILTRQTEKLSNFETRLAQLEASIQVK